MKTNEYSQIRTMDQLRACRQNIDEQLDSLFSWQNLLLPVVKKIREFLQTQ